MLIDHQNQALLIAAAALEHSVLEPLFAAQTAAVAGELIEAFARANHWLARVVDLLLDIAAGKGPVVAVAEEPTETAPRASHLPAQAVAALVLDIAVEEASVAVAVVAVELVPGIAAATGIVTDPAVAVAAGEVVAVHFEARLVRLRNLAQPAPVVAVVGQCTQHLPPWLVVAVGASQVEGSQLEIEAARKGTEIQVAAGQLAGVGTATRVTVTRAPLMQTARRRDIVHRKKTAHQTQVAPRRFLALRDRQGHLVGGYRFEWTRQKQYRDRKQSVPNERLLSLHRGNSDKIEGNPWGREKIPPTGTRCQLQIKIINQSLVFI